MSEVQSPRSSKCFSRSGSNRSPIHLGGYTFQYTVINKKFGNKQLQRECSMKYLIHSANPHLDTCKVAWKESFLQSPSHEIGTLELRSQRPWHPPAFRKRRSEPSKLRELCAGRLELLGPGVLDGDTLELLVAMAVFEAHQHTHVLRHLRSTVQGTVYQAVHAWRCPETKQQDVAGPGENIPRGKQGNHVGDIPEVHGAPFLILRTGCRISTWGRGLREC